MANLGWYVVLVLTSNLLIAMAVVLPHRRSPIGSIAWIMAIVFLPIIGLILYLFLGANLMKKNIAKVRSQDETDITRLRDRQKERLAQGEVLFQDPQTRTFEEIAKLQLKASGAIVSQDNAITVLDDGKSKFTALIRDLQQAREFIHLQYYIICDDELGQSVISTLAAKAKQGVNVRILYDGLGSLGIHKRLLKPLLEAGGECFPFLPPFTPMISLHLNYRNHRKICVIDGQVGYVGGFNICNDYLGLKKLGFWRDLHLRIAGSAVADLELRFLLDWRFATGSTDKIKEHFIPPSSSAGNTTVQIVSSGPDSKWPSIKYSLVAMLYSAQKHIYIITPYFIPDCSTLDALKTKALAGIDVKIIIPNKPDQPLVYWANRSYIEELQDAGIRFFEYSKGFIHSKVVAVDSSICNIGTANFDVRSFDLNFDINAIIYDPDKTKEVEALILRDIEDSKEITQEQFKQRPWTNKAKEAFCRLFSPQL